MNAGAHHVVDQPQRFPLVQATPAFQAYLAVTLNSRTSSGCPQVVESLKSKRPPCLRGRPRLGIATGGGGRYSTRSRRKRATQASASPAPVAESRSCRICRRLERCRAHRDSRPASGPAPGLARRPHPAPSSGWECAAHRPAVTNRSGARRTTLATSRGSQSSPYRR